MKIKRKTPQRREIIKYLTNNYNHPTAFEIYKAVKKKIPSISFATVYNNLKSMLLEKQLVSITDGERLRFDPDNTPHDHFICIKCGKIYDIQKIIKNLRYKNLKVISHISYVRGVCEKCLKKTKEEK
ncbi:MAG: transcriptional repressor [Elusimicrobiota bacterium]